MKAQLLNSLFFLLLSLFLLPSTRAQIEGGSPPYVLNVDQLKNWSPTAPTADDNNIATVPLAKRFSASNSQLNPQLSTDIKVLSAPDGMNNLGNYMTEQNQFNLFNFTHWQYIDVLNWFGGTASQNIVLPSAPWVNAAHKNGVKVIGSVFFAPTAWGGNSAVIDNFMEQDANGNYIAADKLIEIALYYGFDGWLFNQETSTSLAVATAMRSFMAYLQDNKPAEMEIHWYDAMIETGPVIWQNQLNSLNDAYLQDLENQNRTSDAIFTNYNWNSAYVQNSSNYTTVLGRSKFDVYMGADLWPDRNAQPVFDDVTWIDQIFNNGNLSDPLTSIALFATNFTYAKYNNYRDDPNDVENFYDTERRFFSGDDRDIDMADGSGKWKGLGNYIPAKSVITNLPFKTSFNTGHGRLFAVNGVETVRDWHDMGKQDILPTWQFSLTGNSPLIPSFDFSQAFDGGSSLNIAGSLNADDINRLKLYKTKLGISANTKIDVTFKMGATLSSNTKLMLSFSDDSNSFVSFDLGDSPDSGWSTKRIDLGQYNGLEIAVIGLEMSSPTAVSDFSINIGQIKIENDSTPAPIANFSSDRTTAVEGDNITFADQSSDSSTSWSWTFEGGIPAASNLQNPVVEYPIPGDYDVSLRVANIAGEDELLKTGYITILAEDTEVDHTDFGGIITARSEKNEGESRYRAIDNRYTPNDFSKWVDASGIPKNDDPSWLQIEFPEAKIVNKLALISSDDNLGTDPQKILLVASNDGVNYDELTKQNGIDFTSRYERIEWTFPNTTSYTHYKLVIAKNDDNQPETQLAEIQLLGPAGNNSATSGAVALKMSTFSFGPPLEETDSVVLFPNPSTSTIRITGEGISPNSSWDVYTQTGIFVRTITGNEDNEMNVEDMANGMYYIMGHDNLGEVMVKRFVKN
ncbi:endo-beta-N-acetylglucosaminidase [Arenibacter aquaticus]|nr:PKD domain-containing protein [Arenibacter aquaticus]